jgi:putative Mg2+ transporter-C (MgtC) family protein
MPTPPSVLLVRILVAAGLAALLGFERELRREPAGLRTNILIGTGAALFMILSIEMTHGFGGSADRIAAQVVTGIGFLGAGSILHNRRVHTLTTAAAIWVNAAIGMTAGAGLLLLATGVAVITLIVLVVLRPIERFFDRRAAGFVDADESAKTGRRHRD